MTNYYAIIRVAFEADSDNLARQRACEIAGNINDGAFTNCAQVTGLQKTVLHIEQMPLEDPS